MSVKEKEYLEHRRDEAFNALLELMVERRRVLSIVQDSSSLMSMQYQMKAEASQTRMEAHDTAEQSIKIWSTKLDRRTLMSEKKANESRETSFKL